MSDLLSDPHRLKSDANMILAGLRRRYPIPRQTIEDIIAKIGEHLAKNVDTDELAKLAKIIVEMEKQNQSDEHLQDKNNRLDSGRPTEHIIEYHIVEAGSQNAEDAPKADSVPQIPSP